MVSLAKIDPDLDLPLDDPRYRAAYDRVYAHPAFVEGRAWGVGAGNSAYEAARRVLKKVKDERRRREKEEADARAALHTERKRREKEERDALAALNAKHYRGPAIKSARWIDPTSIVILPNRRPLDEDTVAELVTLFEERGMGIPIDCRFVPNESTIVLVDGHHRLTAWQRLGWGPIPVNEFVGDEDDARLWEMEANDCRKESDEFSRADNLLERIRIKAKKAGQACPPLSEPEEPATGGRGNVGGLSKLADDTGISRETLRRARKIADMPAEVKQAARKAGIAGNKTAVLAVADVATQEAQLAEVEAQAARLKAGRKSPTPAPKPTAAELAQPVTAEPDTQPEPVVATAPAPVAPPPSAAVPAEEDADAKLIRQLTWALEDGHRALLQAALDAINAGFTTARFFDESGRQWKPPANTNTPTDAAA